jgi:putative SOS response-associated peptidase YedK
VNRHFDFGDFFPVNTPQRGAASTLLTTDPSADVAPIHDRQMVILERSDWSAWLQGTGNEADLLYTTGSRASGLACMKISI